MAPSPPTGRAAVLAVLRRPEPRSKLPWCFGSPTPQVGIACEDGRWQLRRVELDRPRFAAFCAAREAAGQPLFPEHADAFYVPTGELLAEAPDLESFCRTLEELPWPNDW